MLKQVDHGEDAEKVYRKTYQTGSKALYFGQNKDQNESVTPHLSLSHTHTHTQAPFLAGFPWWWATF